MDVPIIRDSLSVIDNTGYVDVDIIISPVQKKQLIDKEFKLLMQKHLENRMKNKFDIIYDLVNDTCLYEEKYGIMPNLNESEANTSDDSPLVRGSLFVKNEKTGFRDLVEVLITLAQQQKMDIDPQFKTFMEDEVAWMIQNKYGIVYDLRSATDIYQDKNNKFPAEELIITANISDNVPLVKGWLFAFDEKKRQREAFDILITLTQKQQLKEDKQFQSFMQKKLEDRIKAKSHIVYQLLEVTAMYQDKYGVTADSDGSSLLNNKCITSKNPTGGASSIIPDNISNDVPLVKEWLFAFNEKKGHYEAFDILITLAQRQQLKEDKKFKIFMQDQLKERIVKEYDIVYELTDVTHMNQDKYITADFDGLSILNSECIKIKNAGEAKSSIISKENDIQNTTIESELSDISCVDTSSDVSNNECIESKYAAEITTESDTKNTTVETGSSDISCVDTSPDVSNVVEQSDDPIILEKNDFVCGVCMKFLQGYIEARKHMDTHNTMNCLWCCVPMPSDYCFQSHFIDHSSSFLSTDKLIRCPFCGAWYKSLSIIKEHIIESHSASVKELGSPILPEGYKN